MQPIGQFIPPQSLPSYRGGHVVIANQRAYHITKRTELEDDAFGLPVHLGRWKFNLYCCNRPNCKATGIILYNEFTNQYSGFQMNVGKEHTEECPFDLLGICVEYYRNFVYEKLKNRECDTVAAAHALGETAFLQFYPLQVNTFPNREWFKAKGNKILKARFPALPGFDQLVNLDIPDTLRVTLHNEPFLLFQHSFFHPADARYPHGRMETMIVYSTAARFKEFSSARSIYADGTFKVCPNPFYQLYILHVPFQTRLRPCVFCLLTRKTEFTYTLLFERLRGLAQEREHPMQVQKFRCDFEIAQMNGAASIFFANLPQLQLEKSVTGCFFHLCSAIYKKGMELGLSVAYRNPHTHVKTTMKMCMALAFLPVEDINVTFGLIMNDYAQLPAMEPARPNLDDFFAYMHQSWVLGGVASRARWSISDLKSRRTTNDCEGYHSHLLRVIGANTNLWSFLEKLKNEEKCVHNDIQRLNDGQLPRGKAKYIRIHW